MLLGGSSTFGVNVRYETDANKVVYEGPVRVDERCENQEQIKDANCLAGNVEGYFDICVTEDGESIGRIDIPVSEDISEDRVEMVREQSGFPRGSPRGVSCIPWQKKGSIKRYPI